MSALQLFSLVHEVHVRQGCGACVLGGRWRQRWSRTGDLRVALGDRVAIPAWIVGIAREDTKPSRATVFVRSASDVLGADAVAQHAGLVGRAVAVLLTGSAV